MVMRADTSLIGFKHMLSQLKLGRFPQDPFSLNIKKRIVFQLCILIWRPGWPTLLLVSYAKNKVMHVLPNLFETPTPGK